MRHVPTRVCLPLYLLVQLTLSLFVVLTHYLLVFTVILAADQTNARSILLYQTNLDKVKQLSSHSAMGVSGPNCDSVNFTEYVLSHVCLYICI
jgi:hypothetical protein